MHNHSLHLNADLLLGAIDKVSNDTDFKNVLTQQSQEITLIQSLIKSILTSTTPDSLTTFPVMPEQIISLSELYPVAQNYLHFLLTQLEVSAINYRKLLPYSHTYHAPELIRFTTAQTNLLSFIKNRVLPENLEILENFLILLNTQLSNPITTVQVDFQTSRLQINQPAYVSGYQITIPKFIDINQLICDIHQPTRLYFCGDSTAAKILAAPNSRIVFEDTIVQNTFFQNHPSFQIPNPIVTDSRNLER